MGILVFPPHSRIDEISGECVGRFIARTKKILAEYAIGVDVICAPPIRIYRMLENADLDFTINIKSTKALPNDIVFVDTPFSTLQLDLYTHKNVQSMKSVAAIRGFSYHGFRTKLMREGYEFFDLPTSISAIQLFLKKRTNHLISYRAPVDYYIEEKKLKIKDGVDVLPLIEVPTYYAISGQSPHIGKLKAAFNDYASKHHLRFFDQQN
jgi:polar amino acid transport system substrate-binding protein